MSASRLICLMGFYTSVSMTLAFYDVPAGPRSLPCRKVQGGGIGMDGVAFAMTAKIANASAARVRIVALKDVRFIRSSSQAPRQAFDRRCTGEDNQDWTASE
jgi:hypothetical protein